MIFDMLIAVLVIVVIICFLLYLKQHKVQQYLQQFPLPPNVPFLGHVLEFKTTTEYLETLHRFARKFGKLVAVKIGPLDGFLVVTDSKFLEFVLGTSKILGKTINYKYFESWLGSGLLLSSGQKWKTHRKMITPAFHFKILEQFIDVFDSASDVLVTKLKQQNGNKNLDVYPYVTLCALDIICESIMGTQMNAQENEDSLYVRSVKEMCRILIVRTISPFHDIFFPLFKDYWIQKRSLKILHDYTNTVIDKKLAELASKNEDEVGAIKRKKRMAFLDLILESTVEGRPLNRKEIIDEVSTFIFAGHDTTAAAISFTLYCLANHPDVQDKVFNEQQLIFGDVKNPVPSYSQLQEMKYLDLVIKETLRLYPPIPVIGRQPEEDVEHEGQVIPKGAGLVVFIRGIHMNPEYFPDPEKFDPNRFKDYDEKWRYSYLPFSAGPRNCIGQKFATVEIKSVVSKVIRNFQLSPALPHHTLQLAAETDLKSTNGIKMSLNLRK